MQVSGSEFGSHAKFCLDLNVDFFVRHHAIKIKTWSDMVLRTLTSSPVRQKGFGACVSTQETNQKFFSALIAMAITWNCFASCVFS